MKIVSNFKIFLPAGKTTDRTNLFTLFMQNLKKPRL